MVLAGPGPCALALDSLPLWVGEDRGYRLVSGIRLCDPLSVLRELGFEATEDSYRVWEIVDTKVGDWGIRRGLPLLEWFF